MSGPETDAKMGLEQLRDSHRTLLRSCCHAADAAHLLSMGRAPLGPIPPEAVDRARALHKALLALVEVQAVLLDSLSPPEPERPTLALIPGGAQ